MDYNAPSGSTDANAGYVGKTASTIGSKLPPKAAEFPQREIVAAEACAGLVPSNGDTTQLPQAIGRGLWIGTLGASANALVGAIGGGAVVGTVLKVLNPWTRLRGIAAQSNTSATVNVTITGVGTSGGSVAGLLKKRDGSAPVAGDVPVGFPFEIQYDGTNFRFVGLVASDGAGGAAQLDALNAPNNLKIFTCATRVPMSVGANAGDQVFISGAMWSLNNGVYTKKSATSRVRLLITAPTLCQNNTPTGPGYIVVGLGAQSKRKICGSFYPSNAIPPTSLLFVFDGLPAGDLALTVGFGRGDNAAWQGWLNPTAAADYSGLPPTSATEAAIEEVAP